MGKCAERDVSAGTAGLPALCASPRQRQTLETVPEMPSIPGNMGGHSRAADVTFGQGTQDCGSR